MRFLFFLFIIWWIVFMIILPIKRSNFEDGIPKKSFLKIKFLISFILAMIGALMLLKYEQSLFNYFQ
jgi:predicted secreted protein